MEDSLLVFNNMAVHNNHQFVYDDVSGVLSTLQQPFHISPTETFTSAFKFPADMAATLGFPFTEAQWRELKRQAMIYKYMMASLPVPLHLLISADSAAFYSPSSFRDVNLRLGTNGRDQEPGRCRRTDGKKWRCSRDAAPDQKYCERHMHRGRPRSRKPVEQLHATNTINTSHTNKKTRRDLFVSVDSPATLPVSDVSVNKNEPLPLLFNQSDYKVANADVNVNCTVPAYKEIRSLEWMKMKGETFSISTSEQPHSRHTDVGLATDSRFNSFHVLDQHHYPDQPMNLSLFGNVGAGQYQQGNKGTMFMNDSLPHTNQVDDEMSRVQISLGTIESEENQEHINVTSFSMAAATTPGGPLAEVLHSGAITAQSASAAAFADSPTTTATSPDGIVQTSRVLFSESSDKSSLTLVAI